MKSDEIIDGRFRIKSEIAVLPYGVKYLCSSVGEETRSEVLVINLSGLSQDNQQRLAKDIATASRLRHKNIVPALGYGQIDEGAYLSEKTGQGRTLVEHLERRKKLEKPFERTESFSLLSHICNAIQFASEPMGHGTLRTSSVVINSNGRVQIRHFGIGVLRQSIEPESVWGSGLSTHPRSTAGQ